MKKKKLVVDYEIDFDLFGLISTVKDYKLAWLLNKHLSIHLTREEDLSITFVSGGRLVLSNYLYTTEYSSIRLLRNKDIEHIGIEKSYLLPELNNFDYFLQLRGMSQWISEGDLITRVKEVPDVEYITRVDVSKLRSRENLIFE